MPIIEEGRGGDDPLVRMALRQYLQPLVDRHMDVLVLGLHALPDPARTLIAATVGAERAGH